MFQVMFLRLSFKFSLVFIASLLLEANLSGEWIQSEVCVYGDSPAAVASAVQVGRMGRNVVLALPGHHAGGILVNGLGSNDLDNHSFKNSVAVGGIALEYYKRVAQKYGAGNGYRAEPHVSEAVFEDMLDEAGVRILRGYRLSEKSGAVDVTDKRIQSLTFENGDSIEAQIFIDGTVEGDLMAFAGVSYAVGREPNATYNETLNGIVTNTSYRQFSVDIDPYVIPGDPASGLIHGVQGDALGVHGEGDGSIMGFCFRMVLTNDEDNRIDIAKPEDYDESRYEIYLRYFAVSDARGFFYPRNNVPGGKSDIGSWHDLSANLYGYNHGWPDGSYSEREKIYRFHQSFTLGLIWFLQNDPRVPGLVRERWEGWGLPKDEFGDNGNWPRMLYIRSGRRMLGRYVITEADLTEGSPEAEDPVGVAFWPPDMHHSRRIVKDGKVWNEGFIFGGGLDWKPFGISYKAMTPKSEECVNLLVPAAISSSYVAYGALRLEWTFMVTGQSAGTAAVLALETESSVQDIDYPQLRSLLLVGGQILNLGMDEPSDENGVATKGRDTSADNVSD